MQVTLTLDDELLAQAEEYTGISDKSALIYAALRALVEREAARRLARLGGSQPDLKPIPRRGMKRGWFRMARPHPGSLTVMHLAHPASPAASRRPDSKSSRCSGLRKWVKPGTTRGVISRNRAMIARASSRRPIWA